jgi:hypothetical protein
MKINSFKRTFPTLTAICFLLVLSVSSSAQEKSYEYSSKMSVGASLSTAGPGINLALGITKPLLIRIGVEHLSCNVPFSFDENGIDYDANLDYRAGSFSLIADYNFTRILFVSAGAGFNLFKPAIEGYASRDWKYGDISIPAQDVGEFGFTMQPSYRLSPYLGGGIGRKIARSGRLAFSMEAGVFYQGPPKISIEATGLLSPTADEAHGHKEHLENQFSSWRVYPVVKAGLSFLISR